MNKSMKKFKDVLGASLMEVILVLGIMAVLTPVVMKYAFKDLGDVKYLNLAKQFKQLIKSLSAYTSSERDSWTSQNGEISISDLDKYGLTDTIEKTIVDNLSIRYVKYGEGDDSRFALYGVVKMEPFHLDPISFNKVLGYVGDHIGYVVNGEKCGSCSGTVCACAINGNWGVNYSDTVTNVSNVKNGDLIAVVRIDDALLEDEYDSTIYLYRNRNDSGLNEMNRDFYLGSNELNMNDVKNVKEVNAQTTSGLATIGGESAVVNKLRLLKSKAGNIAGDIQVKTSIYFKEASTPVLNFVGAKIFVPKIIFEKSTELANFMFSNAYLMMGDLGSYKPKLTVNNLTTLENIDLQTLSVTTLTSDDFNKLDVYGFDEEKGGLDSDMDKELSKLRVEAPNVDITNMNAKIININNHYMQSSNGKISFRDGIISFSDNVEPNIELYDLKGNPEIRSVWGLISKFEAGTTGTSNDCTIQKKFNRYKAFADGVVDAIEDKGCDGVEWDADINN